MPSELDIGERLPFGFCSECLERMRLGDAYEALTVAPDRSLVHAYCPHREAGALLYVVPDRPLRWQLVVPIDALEWGAYVRLHAHARAGFHYASRQEKTPTESAKLN